MTNILIITNKEDLTTDFVIYRLQERGIPYYRLNTEDICQGIDLTIIPQEHKCFIKDYYCGRTIDLMSFDSIYYRRPEIRDYLDKELSVGEKVFLSTELHYSLEGLYKMLNGKYWVSPLYAIREAENKIYQLTLAHQLGFNTPETIVSSNPDDINVFLKKNKGLYVIKPIHNGRIIDSLNSEVVYTSVLDGKIDENCARYSQNYIQQRIDKLYDVRVTIVGKTHFAVKINSQDCTNTLTDWRKGQTILKHEVIQLPREIEEKSKALMKQLRLRYAAIDFAVDKKGRYVFFEINPNGQWAWIEHLTGLPISNEIVNLLLYQNV